LLTLLLHHQVSTSHLDASALHIINLHLVLPLPLLQPPVSLECLCVFAMLSLPSASCCCHGCCCNARQSVSLMIPSLQYSADQLLALPLPELLAAAF
jgi:hypothetical protein